MNPAKLTNKIQYGNICCINFLINADEKNKSSMRARKEKITGT